ncbi:RNA polymerase sigma factor SigF [Streptomyces fuscigenes]|uniref:RNA polymerase sigma factor SigF n=1 Tax=Streptomyces fuscigenes TaxID=1528880 RepID=UPI001F23A6DE|nr:RNA polymerase sigma factor SigF [Streptomyces fuscigenes]MCF3960628.1 RNA polymerase sigma factor SigF [Streptomyces fuscigenes]
MSPRLDEPRTPIATSASTHEPSVADVTLRTYGPDAAAHEAPAPAVSPETQPLPASAAFAGVDDLPPIPPQETFGDMDAVDARVLSRSLFARLETLEEGTHAHAYVRNTLVELNLALVKFAASRFRTRSEPMEDIVQVGTIGLIKSIDRFELSRGVEFPTFAMPTIIGEIKRFFRDTSWSVRVPRRLQELRLDLAKTSDELAQRLDRAPSVSELSEALGISREEVVEGMTASNAYTASSLDAQPEEEDGGEATLGDRIGYEDHGIEGIEYIESLKPLIAGLPHRDRQILSLRFVANMTQSEIGEELGISQMHVSRLLSRTLVKLRRGLTLDE